MSSAKLPPPLNIDGAITYLERCRLTNRHGDERLFVKVFNPGSIGGTPCVEVTHISAGFDWDNGKILLSTERPVTLLSPEDIAAIRESVKGGQSWHAFKHHEQQANRIKELEAEVARLKVGAAQAPHAVGK